MRCVSVSEARTRWEHDSAVDGVDASVGNGEATAGVGVTLSDGVIVAAAVGDDALEAAVAVGDVDGGDVACAQPATITARAAVTTGRCRS
jgi:hypothetical protein